MNMFIDIDYVLFVFCLVANMETQYQLFEYYCVATVMYVPSNFTIRSFGIYIVVTVCMCYNVMSLITIHITNSPVLLILFFLFFTLNKRALTNNVFRLN